MRILHRWVLCAGVLAAGPGVAGASIVVDYPMNEASGTLTDVASGVNMTPADESAFTYAVPSVPAGTYGGITVSAAQAAAFGTAVSGNGTAVFSNSTSGNALNNLAAPFTVMAWVNPTSAAGRQRILSGSYGDGNGWGYGLDSGNQIFTTYAVTDYGPISAGTAQEGAWQHVAVTFDGGTATFYLNGAMVDSRTGGNRNANPNETFALFGSSNPGEFFNGALDEVRVYNAALTPDEIVAAAVAVPEPAALGLLGAAGLLLARRRCRA